MKSLTVYYVLIFLLNFKRCYQKTLNQLPFPDGFQFGVATASYQIEGAWDKNGKGENIWDYLTHNNASHITDRSNGDIACDSYHKYKEDVQLVRSLGVDFYRFSLSWSRILPTGYPNFINPDGIRYYNDLINELLDNQIEPMVTIFHWDLPQPLQQIGGWPNAALIEHYVNYARIVFEHFGDRVKKWITFNEPMQICKMGYGDVHMAPAYPSSGMADYMCTYTVIKAHSQTYHMYNNSYKSTQKGEVGYTIHSFWFEPSTKRVTDTEAAHRMFDFYTAIFINPIYGNGDWPETVKHNVRKMSRAQNFTSSRLPAFTHEEIKLNKGTADFLGLNYYTSAMVTSIGEIFYPVKWDNDGRFTYHLETEIGSPVGPVGLRKILKKIKHVYGDYKIIITENGIGTPDRIHDYDRANYYLTFLEACLEAIYHDEVNLVGYTAWSLMDNFEWAHGYTNRFGIHHVDFNHPNRTRTRKLSANVFEDVVTKRKLPKTIIQVPSNVSHATILQQSLFMMLFSVIISAMYNRFWERVSITCVSMTF